MLAGAFTHSVDRPLVFFHRLTYTPLTATTTANTLPTIIFTPLPSSSLLCHQAAQAKVVSALAARLLACSPVCASSLLFSFCDSVSIVFCEGWRATMGGPVLRRAKQDVGGLVGSRWGLL